MPFGFRSEATCECDINPWRDVIALRFQAYMSAPHLYSRCCGSFLFLFKLRNLGSHSHSQMRAPPLPATGGRAEVVSPHLSPILVAKSCCALPLEIRSGLSVRSCLPTTAGFPWPLLGVEGIKEDMRFNEVEPCFSCCLLPPNQYLRS